MGTVIVTTCTANGLVSGIPAISEIRIEDPLGNGGFGTVYPCQSINGVAPSVDLVVKLLADDGTGCDQRGYETVRDLIIRIDEANDGRQMRGEPLLQQNPAHSGLPIAAFIGTTNGKRSYGYLTRRLDTIGFAEFEGISDGSDPALRAAYTQLSIDELLQLTNDLVTCLYVFETELFFQHADISPANIWLNVREKHLTLIDFDGGAVAGPNGGRPNTLGRINDWAPLELLAAVAAATGNIPVTMQCDRWSLAIAVSYLLTLMHPLLALRQISIPDMTDYCSKYAWPDINPADPNFNHNNTAAYTWYCQRLSSLPPAIVELLRIAMQEGALNPDKRPTAETWLNALVKPSTPPIIHLFEIDPPTAAPGDSVLIRWWIEGATQVEVSPGYGRVAQSETRLHFASSSTVFTLYAKNGCGDTTADCRLTVMSPTSALSSAQAGPTNPNPSTAPPAPSHSAGNNLPHPFSVGPQLRSGSPQFRGFPTANLYENLPQFPWKSFVSLISTLAPWRSPL